MTYFMANFVFLQGLKKLTVMISEDECNEVFPSAMSSYLNSYNISDGQDIFNCL